MTPSEFMQLYRAMAVVLDDNTVHAADVHQYMIHTATNSRVQHAAADVAKNRSEDR